MRSKLTPLFVAAALAASMGSADAYHSRAGMRSVGYHHHYGMAHGRYGMTTTRYGVARVRYGMAGVGYGSAPAYYGAGPGYYGGYSDAGPLGLATAPFDAAGGLFGDDVYGYGGGASGCCGDVYGAGQPPVVAGY